MDWNQASESSWQQRVESSQTSPWFSPALNTLSRPVTSQNTLIQSERLKPVLESGWLNPRRCEIASWNWFHIGYEMDSGRLIDSIWELHPLHSWTRALSYSYGLEPGPCQRPGALWNQCHSVQRVKSWRRCIESMPNIWQMPFYSP